VNAVSFGCEKYQEFRHNVPTLLMALEAFEELSDLDMPPAEMLIFGSWRNRAYVVFDGGRATVEQPESGTVLKVSSFTDSGVAAVGISRADADRRREMLAMLPRTLEIAVGGQSVGFPRSLGAVSAVYVAGRHVPASEIERASTVLGERIVGLTAEGWVVVWYPEFGRVMTGYATPEEYGLHRFTRPGEASAVGLEKEAYYAEIIYRENGGQRQTLARVRSVMDVFVAAEDEDQPVPAALF
jgi:hypothetical protein